MNKRIKFGDKKDQPYKFGVQTSFQLFINCIGWCRMYVTVSNVTMLPSHFDTTINMFY